MQELINDIADAIRKVDCSGIPFKQFQPGAGPYGEPQLTKLIVNHLSTLGQRYSSVKNLPSARRFK